MVRRGVVCILAGVLEAADFLRTQGRLGTEGELGLWAMRQPTGSLFSPLNYFILAWVVFLVLVLAFVG